MCSLSLGVRILHITPVTLPCMVKMLLHWRWFAPTAWHAHNCEWTSSRRILNISCRNPVGGVSTDDLQWYYIIHCSRKYLSMGVQSVGWILDVWWPPLLPQSLCLWICFSICLPVCLLDCLFVCCVLLLSFSFFFCFNLMTLCQVFHGDYWPPCSSFHVLKVINKKK